MRTQLWLQDQLEQLLKGAFSDMEVMNRLTVQWGRKASRRFGSIKMSRDKKVSEITINGIFRDEAIPEQIVQATLAHELTHYVHGFSSPLPKKYKHPHAGGIIEREFKKRGLSLLSAYEKQWTKNKWPNIVKESFPQRVRRAHRSIRLVRRPKGTKRGSLIDLLFELF